MYRRPSERSKTCGGEGSWPALSPLLQSLPMECLTPPIESRLGLPHACQVNVPFYNEFYELPLDSADAQRIYSNALPLESTGGNLNNSDSLNPTRSEMTNGILEDTSDLKKEDKQNDGHISQSLGSNFNRKKREHCTKLTSSADQDTFNSMNEDVLFSKKPQEKPRKKPRKRTRSPSHLPPDFHIPLHIFSPPLVERVSRGQQLRKADLSDVITAVFRYVAPSVPYPTRRQYCEIIDALFITLPQLPCLSPSCHAACAEWRHRLSHKFRNCRRKTKQPPRRTMPPRRGRRRRGRPPLSDAAGKHSATSRRSRTLQAPSPLSLDTLLALIHSQLQVPQYVALRVLLLGVKPHPTPVTEDNVHMVNGRRLIVEIDDLSFVDLPEIDSVDVGIAGKTKKITLKIEPTNRFEPNFPSAGVTHIPDCKKNLNLLNSSSDIADIQGREQDLNVPSPSIDIGDIPPCKQDLYFHNFSTGITDTTHYKKNLNFHSSTGITDTADCKEDLDSQSPSICITDTPQSKQDSNFQSLFNSTTDAGDSETDWEIDVSFLSPSTRIETEEDHLRHFHADDKEETLDFCQTLFDFDALDKCGLGKDDLDSTTQLGLDLGAEVLSFKGKRLKRRYRYQEAPLPPGFSVPAGVFPATVVAKVALRLPLSRADLCSVTAALFAHVMPRIPYPSRHQYSAIIRCLFTALPGLQDYSNCIETAHTEWKYRLSQKFRNFRRKKAKKNGSRPRRGSTSSSPPDWSLASDEFCTASLWTNESLFSFEGALASYRAPALGDAFCTKEIDFN